MSAADAIERALQLAASGKYSNLEGIRRTLVRENYEDVDQHLAGASIKAQIKALLAKSAMGDEL